MPKIANNSICLPLGERESGKCCLFELTGFSSFVLRLEDYHDECKTCPNRGSILCSKLKKRTALLPFAVRTVTKAYDGKEYFIHPNGDRTRFHVDISIDRCAVCGNGQHGSAGLIPIMNKFLCEDCFNRARHYLLVTT